MNVNGEVVKKNLAVFVVYYLSKKSYLCKACD